MARRNLGYLVGALLIAGSIWGWRGVSCFYATDGETIGGMSVETLGEYETAVDRASKGCTEVILTDQRGRVIENPDPDTPIQPMTGQLLMEPITVVAKR